MMKRSTALFLAILFLCTTSCAQREQVENLPPVKSTQSPQLGPDASMAELFPEDQGPTWEEGRTLDVALPGDYNGLELPFQGATGYASVQLPLWAAVEDAEAAAQAVADWEAAEAARLTEEQSTQASASLPLPSTAAPAPSVSSLSQPGRLFFLIMLPSRL